LDGLFAIEQLKEKGKKNNKCEVVLRMEVATKGVATDGKTFYTKIDSITDKFLMDQTRRFF